MNRTACCRMSSQRTRASLRGARWFLGSKLQGAVGAVKKASPFWDASGLQAR
jgi:hypothetical protein